MIRRLRLLLAAALYGLGALIVLVGGFVALVGRVIEP